MKRLLTECLLLALMMAAACPGLAQAEDVTLSNTGFESGQATSVPGWSVPYPDIYQGTATLARDQAKTGSQSLEISDPYTSTGMGIRHKLVTAIPGASYQASGWVLCKSGRVRLYLEFFSPDRSRLNEDFAESNAENKWEKLALVRTCPKRAKWVSVTFYATVGNTGVAYVDEVQLKVEVPPEVKANQTGPVVVGDRAQLLFDDYFTDTRKHLDFHQAEAQKSGRKLLVADKPWESFCVNAWNTVMQDDDPLDASWKYRMWYEAYAQGGDLHSRLAYARSKDGLVWEKPDLGLVEFAGTRHNNLVFEGACGHGQHGGTVFKDPTAPPDERYKYLYLAGSYVAGAVSPDGLHWKPIFEPEDLICDISSDTQSVAWWDADLKRYVAFVRMWRPNRLIGRTESTSFCHFPKPQVVLACDDKDAADSDLYNSAALKYPYADRAYFIFTSIFNHPTDNLWVELAVSRDSYQWERPGRKPFIPLGRPGAFDSRVIYAGSGLLRFGDELHLNYWGLDKGHNESGKERHFAGTESYVKIGLNRFVGFEAKEQTGILVTRPLLFSGRHLELNFHAPEGSLRVELEDESGNPLEGFSLADCDRLKGDCFHARVSWRGHSELPGIGDKPVKLKFELQQAQLYAFQFVQSATDAQEAHL